MRMQGSTTEAKSACNNNYNNERKQGFSAMTPVFDSNRQGKERTSAAVV
jgi:hypothetical protein